MPGAESAAETDLRIGQETRDQTAGHPTVDWPYLRVWAENNSEECLYRVRLADYATPVNGSYQPAWAEFELSGPLSAGDYAGIAWPGEHHTYQVLSGDTPESVVKAIVDSINAFSAVIKATQTGAKARLYYVGAGGSIDASRTGHNGNRFGACTYYSGTCGAAWSDPFLTFSNGLSPDRWRVQLPFSNLLDVDGRVVPTTNVRKMRWTYSANLQNSSFVRSEFCVHVSSWQVSGSGRAYKVAGPGSRRIENEDAQVKYAGTWNCGRGNFSSGSIEFSDTPGSTVRCDYVAPFSHDLYLGTRIADKGASVSVTVEVRAEANGRTLKIIARAMGAQGNEIALAVSPEADGFRLIPSGTALSGGSDGQWITDLQASPRLNRAARDWTTSYFRALSGYGLGAVAAFSMELQHGDTTTEAGIAQRYPNGNATVLTTPAVQTNFSPASTEFWKDVYLNMADLMRAAGCQPYLQFGEVQWWYFPSDGSGMPFYDDYTRAQFRNLYGRDLRTIPNQQVDPSQFAEEAEFLPSLIGAFTDAIMAHVRQSQADCKFEVLYPTDVNESRFNRAINYPLTAWSPNRLACLKTESFSYTLGRNFNMSRESVSWGEDLGFAGGKKSHLVGISDPKTSWLKETRLGEDRGLESVVLFALDQFCLVGYRWPRAIRRRRSFRVG